jgi:predicted O-methyltransferase YrrM
MTSSNATQASQTQAPRGMGAQLRRLVGPRRAAHIQFLRRVGLQYWPIAGYTELAGWLTEGEALRLFDLARGIRRPGAVAVEVGSWLGRSSVVLAKGLASARGARLYCVDPWNGDGEDYARPEYDAIAQRQPLPLHEQFQENMRAFDVADTVRPLRGYSAEVGRDFAGVIDLLFIDANHEYDSVLEDFRVWSPQLAPDGVIAFHDSDHEGPRAVIEQFIQGRPGWSAGQQVDSLWHARRIAPRA